MVKRAVGVSVFAASLVLVAATALAARQKPDFSGTWIIQAPNKAAGSEIVVKQDVKTLTYTSNGRKLTYQLDGVEQRRTVASRVGEIVVGSKAAWEGSTIVVTTSTAYPNNMKTVERDVWSIDKQGQLVIDFTESAQGEKPRLMKVVHRKKG